MISPEEFRFMVHYLEMDRARVVLGIPVDTERSAFYAKRIAQVQRELDAADLEDFTIHTKERYGKTQEQRETARTD